MITLEYSTATINDLDAVHQLEAASYHPEEAASRDQLERRIGYAAEHPELFLVAWHENKIAGFLCTTLSTTQLVTDESMSAHEPQGKTVCLHSVCVAPEYRRQGVATALMTHWIKLLKSSRTPNGERQFSRIALLSRPHLISLYESVGFKNIGKSAVVHGPEPWYDCILELEGSE